jgi:beta-lactam-binding protein with PASTA domain
MKRSLKDDILLAGSRIKNFITSSFILRNIGAMLLVLVLSFFLLNAFLNLYTAHGKTVQVDNYEGLMLDEATRKARSRGFEISVDEAPYTNDVAQNTVIDQEPAALSRIKKNRTIYLTVIGPPKEVTLPEFSDFADDYNQYRLQLDVLEVEHEIKERQFDADYEPNTILYAYYEGKKYTPNDIRRGVKVKQGSVVSFVVTKDKSDNVRLPSLVCKRLSEAEFLFSTLDLRMGDVIGEVRGNRADAYIWKQEPAFSSGKQVLRGSAITIHIQSELPAGCEPEIEITLPPETDEENDPGSGTTSPGDSTGF